MIGEDKPNFKTFSQVDTETGLLAVKFQTTIPAGFNRVASVYLENDDDQKKWVDLTENIVYSSSDVCLRNRSIAGVFHARSSASVRPPERFR